jgi:hypothetical protein
MGSAYSEMVTVTISNRFEMVTVTNSELAVGGLRLTVLDC